jgi:peptidoglycan/LPS O-acetylase OafA/YrhL
VRVPQLDLLRGVAVILVLARHMQLPSTEVAPAVQAVAGFWFQISWIAIDSFFVLSGFLIAGLLFSEYQRHGELKIGRFLIRRGFKIYPAFYVMLAATVAVTAYDAQLPEGFLLKVLTEAVYLQNYLPPVWGPTWSLAVEEHFYFVLAAAFFVMVRRGSREDPFRSLVYIVAVLALLVLGLRVYTALTLPYTDRTHFFRTHLRLDGIAWGVLLSYLYHFRRTDLLAFLDRNRVWVAAASAVLLLPPFIWTLGESWILTTVGLTAVDLGFAGLLILSITHPPRLSPRLHRALGAPLARGLAALGFYSYSIYLWHMPVTNWLMESLRRHGWFAFGPPTLAWTLDLAVYVGGSIVLGIIMAKAVEGPSLKLRDRLFPSRSTSLAATLPPRILAPA